MSSLQALLLEVSTHTSIPRFNFFKAASTFRTRISPNSSDTKFEFRSDRGEFPKRGFNFLDEGIRWERHDNLLNHTGLDFSAEQAGLALVLPGFHRHKWHLDDYTGRIPPGCWPINGNSFMAGSPSLLCCRHYPNLRPPRPSRFSARGCWLAGPLPYTEPQEENVMKWTIAVAGLIFVCAASASAQKLDVKIIDRQDKQDEYDYAAVYNNVSVGKSFKVLGATFTLQLPDAADWRFGQLRKQICGAHGWSCRESGGVAACLWWIVFKLSSMVTMQG